MTEELMDWHRLFGLSLKDFFADRPVKVESELDLSEQQQFIDVVLVRETDKPVPFQLPDGLDPLPKHTLITFKSFREPLAGWALRELIGHYVAYRKLVSKTTNDLLPENEFKMIAVSVRYPEKLGRAALIQPVSPGVHDLPCFDSAVRLVVVNDLPREKHNALFHLFSSQEELRVYGAENHDLHSNLTSSLLLQLYTKYRTEGLPMPYTTEQFLKDTAKLAIRLATVEQRLEGIPLEKRLEGVPLEKRLEGIPLEQQKELLLEKLLADLPPEKREIVRKQFETDSPGDPAP